MDEEEKKNIMQSVYNRYEDICGKQLYLRLPVILPKDSNEVLELVRKISPSIVKVHIARQKNGKFCLVDFETTEERDKAFKQIRKQISKGKLPKHNVRLPRTENPEFLNKIAENKVRSVLQKRVKYKMRKLMKEDEKRKLKGGERNCCLRVTNLPRNVTVTQVRDVFPEAIDIHLQSLKDMRRKKERVATIIFPNPSYVYPAYKKEHILGDIILRKTFVSDPDKLRKKNTSTSSKSKNNNTNNKI